jgi:hypothetical protein
MSLDRLITTKRWFVLCVLAFSLILVLPTSAYQTESSPIHPFEDRTDPVLLVASYYNAINLQDYARAFSYWETPPDSTPTLQAFEQGFSNTARIAAFAWVPAFVEVGAGNLFAQVPVFLASELVDGTQQFYFGCFTAHKVNVPVGDATEPDPNWWLDDSHIVEVAEFNLRLLQVSCDQVIELDETFENLTSPVELLASYFGAIEREDYARAFSYWETPPATTPTLDSFAAGFFATDRVILVLRLDISQEGAAGSSYASIPALVTSTLDDGTIQHFAGCYVTRRSNVPVGSATEPDPNWHLYDSEVEAIQTVPQNMSLLQDACAAFSGG